MNSPQNPEAPFNITPGATGMSRRQWLVSCGAAVAASCLCGEAADTPSATSAEDDLVFWSAARLARAIREKAVSSEEVVKAHLRRIEAVNPKLNAIVLLTADSALAEARAADEAQAKGQLKGPLHGVPLTVKDCIDTMNVRTTDATKGYANRVPGKDGVAVARLKAAGAILLGKTNLPELAMAAETDNLVFGRTNNPYDLRRCVAGSSGGEGAIVAAGGSPLGLGSDAGGSIRLPAAFNGIAGLKPSLGRVPIIGHVPVEAIGMGMDVATLGPMARYVADLGLVLPIISGPDGWDPLLVAMPPAEPDKVDLRTLRVAFYTDNGVVPADEETAATVKSAAKVLSDHGVKVEESRPPMIDQTPELFWGTLCTDGGESMRQFLERIGSKEIHPFTKRSLEIASRYAPKSAQATAGLVMRRFGLRWTMQGFMRNYDVLLSPVAPVPATLHGEFQRDIDKNISYTCVHNLTGWPAVSVRAGTSKTGLPIGVQIAAPLFREDLVLAVAQLVESTLGGWKRPTAV